MYIKQVYTFTINVEKQDYACTGGARSRLLPACKGKTCLAFTNGKNIVVTDNKVW